MAVTKPIPYLSTQGNTNYTIYDPTAAESSGYYNTLGEDLIWRLLLKTPEENDVSVKNNFIKNGRFFQDVSNRVMIWEAGKIANTYESEVSTFVLENFNENPTIYRRKVQIGDDLFVESKTTVTEDDVTHYRITTSIVPDLNYTTDYEGSLQTFSNLLDNEIAQSGTTYIFEIGERLYKMYDSEYSSANAYILLTLDTTVEEDANALLLNNYYNYTIQFRSGIITGTTAEAAKLINGYVDQYKYASKEDGNEIAVRIGSNYFQDITTCLYWVYSDGSVRAFYTLAQAIPNFTRNMQYRMYSNFYYSNWYFFQSRETPQLNLNAINTDNELIPFPINNYNNRKINLQGSYSQLDGIGVRYHTWKIDKNDENGATEIFKSDEIYDSDFSYSYEPLDPIGSYTITFTVVNQEGVETSITGDVFTKVNVQEVDANCIATADNENHVVEVTWLNGLGAEPDGNVEGDFGNRIGVGQSEQDAAINESITYSTISGGPMAIDKSTVLIQTGFVINDDAKANGNNKEFYNSEFLTLGSQDGTIHFLKEGLDVNINGGSAWFKLLDDTNGQVTATEVAKTNYFIGKNYIWQEGSGINWTDGNYWTETQSDTNCYYYQFIIGNGTVKYNRAAYWNVEPIEYTSTTVKVPYNPLINAVSGNLKIRIDNGIEGNEETPYVATISSSDNSTMTITVTGGVSGIPKQVVIYQDSQAITGQASFTTPTDTPYNYFTLGPKTDYFYFTVSGENINNQKYNDTTPLSLGQKPTWDDDTLINIRFNGSLISSRQEDLGSAVNGYQIYRRKFKVIGSDGMSPIYDNDNPIYTQLIGTFYLADEGLTTTSKFKFIDWGVENRGTYDYMIIPISSDAGTQATIHTQQKVTTDWYGWSFASFDKFPTGHFEPLERWIFNLNIETGGYAHQTNKVFNQGFNRYPKASIGTVNYITTNLSCLIGNVDKELKKSVLYSNLQGYSNDNITRIEDWEDFSNSSNLILVKDYKGRAFIGVIDGNAMSFQDIVIEILTKLSFNVTQIDNVNNYQIFSVEGVE